MDYNPRELQSLIQRALQTKMEPKKLDNLMKVILKIREQAFTEGKDYGHDMQSNIFKTNTARDSR